MKKHILCLGDSNTHGYCADPNDCADHGIRFNEDERWTCRLQKALGEEYLVTEEGLSGRTTVFVDPLHESMDALSVAYALLKSHEVIDLLIIMLGTNDVKERFGANAACIGAGMERLLRGKIPRRRRAAAHRSRAAGRALYGRRRVRVQRGGLYAPDLQGSRPAGRAADRRSTQAGLTKKCRSDPGRSADFPGSHFHTGRGESSISGTAWKRRAVRAAFFCHTAAFFVDKAPACYYNSVVKMAFLCGFVAARNKYS